MPSKKKQTMAYSFFKAASGYSHVVEVFIDILVTSDESEKVKTATACLNGSETHSTVRAETG